MRFRMNRKGFTLTELSVVLGIVGLLTSIAVPNYLGMQQRSKIKIMTKNPANVESELASRIYAFLHGGDELEYVDWDNDGVVDSGGAPGDLVAMSTQFVSNMNSGGRAAPMTTLWNCSPQTWP